MNYGKHSQKGYFLMALTAVLSVITFIFILGYSTYYSKRASLTLTQAQSEYLLDAKARMLEAYSANALQIDSDLTYTAYRDGEAWLRMAGISKKWNLSVEVSDRIAKDGIKYTSVTLWLPTDEDSAGGPSYNKATGVFNSCSIAPCPSRVFTTFDGYAVQLGARNDTYQLLNDVAVKAQFFFKAKYLSDVVRDVGVNHFTAPRACVATAEEVPCLPLYTPIRNTPLPTLFGLNSQVATNAWGLDIEASNFADSRFDAPPYTMSFRTRDPWGNYLKISAVQPL